MAKKRGNNEGSLYKRKNVNWRAQVSIQGKRLAFSSKSKRECQKWIRQQLEEIDNGLTYESTTITLKAFTDQWLINVEASVRYTTFVQYEQVVRQHILPILGKYKLRDLKPDHIQNLYNRKIEDGVSLRSVQLIHSIIHRALVHAVKLGFIYRNPDDGTTPPIPKTKEMKFLDEDQAQHFLVTAMGNGDQHYPLYYLAIATGMRMGELLGLKWRDINWEQKSLQVQRQLTKKKGGGFEFSTPKTKAGIRRIELGYVTIDVLRMHQKSQYGHIHNMGDKWHNQDLVFPSQIGTHLDKDNLRRRFKKVLLDTKLPEIRFHDLRHTAASLMLNSGIPVIVVSRRLGHAKPSITLDIYGHLIPTKQQEAAALIDQLLTPIQIKI
jgi:integrase